MTECKRIADLLEQTFEGRAYYGQSVLQSLEGVTAEIAARKPEGQPNSIWNIVTHLTLELIYHRELIEGTAGKWIRGETTWASNSDFSNDAWEKAVSELKSANRALVRAIAEANDDLLDQKVPQLNWTFFRSLHGTLHHNIYHAGQITILRRELDLLMKNRR